ncbi:MAG: hypothetical protein R6V47_00030, partial [Candidatus Delongbacteria bacterium]
MTNSSAEAKTSAFFFRSVIFLAHALLPAASRSIYAESGSISAKDASIIAQGLSEDARDASQLAQGLSETAKDAAITAQGLSEDARDASITAQGLSETARDASQLAQSGAETAETNALGSENKAEQWAEELEDVEVEPGKFSSIHHSAKAEDEKIAAIAAKDASVTAQGLSENA